MGQTLSEPVTEKHTTSVVRDKQFWVGLSDMQGWRISMEDSHSVHLSLPAGETAATSEDSDEIPTQPAGSTVSNRNKGDKENAFFGVFDGHGGSAVAKFTGTTIHNRLAGLDSYKSGDYAAALKQLFLKTDEDLRADPNFFNEPSGCTATTALITKDNRIFVANAGDSRTVLGYQGKAKALSDDHKPTNKDETARILAAGGFVEFGRVNGNLALSRAIGDFEFKQNYSLDPEKQIVTADPDIAEHKIDGEEEFLVLACDGIWDCLSSQQVVDFTRRAVANGDSLGTIAENMMTKCLARDSETGGIGCDNMTVVIVALLGGRSPEEWQAWVKDRVEKKVGYNTPESVPDVFGHIQASSGLGGLTGAGFRVAGAGSIANIASILGASGLTLRPVTNDDDEQSDTDSNESNELIDNKGVEEGTQPRDVTDDISNLSGEGKRGSVQLVDDDGDSHMDSGDESDTTTAGAAPANAPASGSSTKDSEKQEQLRSSPKGDEYPAVAKAEGLLDSSESPIKG